MQSSVAAFFHCTKPRLTKASCLYKSERGSDLPAAAQREGMGRSGLPPLDCILDENDHALLPDEHVVFKEMRVLGDCPLNLQPSQGVWAVYKGDCILSKSMQTIPRPDSVFTAEVNIRLSGGAVFRYKGPCVYEDGRGIVPRFDFHLG